MHIGDVTSRISDRRILVFDAKEKIGEATERLVLRFGLMQLEIR